MADAEAQVGRAAGDVRVALAQEVDRPQAGVAGDGAREKMPTVASGLNTRVSSSATRTPSCTSGTPKA